MIWIDLNWRAKQSIVVGCVLVALFHYSCFNSSFSRHGFFAFSFFFFYFCHFQVFYISTFVFFLSFRFVVYVCVFFIHQFLPFRYTFTRARVHFVRLKVWQQQCKSFDLCLWYFIDELWITHIFSHLMLFSFFISFFFESTENQGSRMFICQKYKHTHTNRAQARQNKSRK